MPREGHGALNRPDVRSVPVFVYGLVDPRDGALRYVGRSSNPRARATAHLTSKDRRRIRQWIGDLLAAGARPTLRILQEVPPGEDAAAAEKTWLDKLGPRGLLNVIGTKRPQVRGENGNWSIALKALNQERARHAPDPSPA